MCLRHILIAGTILNNLSFLYKHIKVDLIIRRDGSISCDELKTLELSESYVVTLGCIIKLLVLLDEFDVVVLLDSSLGVSIDCYNLLTCNYEH